MTTVLKLGGSVITDKSRPETVDTANLARTAEAIAAAEVSGLVLVHGGGSFGHHHASRHGVTTTAGTHDPDAVREIHAAMVALNRAVVDALADRGVPAVPVQPLSVAARTGAGFEFPATAAGTMLGEGFVPVTHGDVVAHGGNGATVVSGDELVVSLADSLSAGRVGLCSDVPGVLDADGAVIDHIESFSEVAAVLGGSERTDVTGGMAAKVRELLALDPPADVFDIDGLAAFLDGAHPGTRVD